MHNWLSKWPPGSNYIKNTGYILLEYVNYVINFYKFITPSGANSPIFVS
jgi:hypothetical protein